MAIEHTRLVPGSLRLLSSFRPERKAFRTKVGCGILEVCLPSLISLN